MVMTSKKQKKNLQESLFSWFGSWKRSHFCHPHSVQMYELDRQLLYVHQRTVFYGAVWDLYSLLWDNTGHPCWVLSTRVPGHGVLKLRSDCQEHTQTHTHTRPNTLTTETSQQTQQRRRQTEKRAWRAERIQQQFSYLCVVYILKNSSCTTPKCCIWR